MGFCRLAKYFDLIIYILLNCNYLSSLRMIDLGQLSDNLESVHFYFEIIRTCIKTWISIEIHRNTYKYTLNNPIQSILPQSEFIYWYVSNYSMIKSVNFENHLLLTASSFFLLRLGINSFHFEVHKKCFEYGRNIFVKI